MILDKLISKTKILNVYLVEKYLSIQHIIYYHIGSGKCLPIC